MKIGNYIIKDDSIEAISEIKIINLPPLPNNFDRGIDGYAFNIFTKGGNSLEIFDKDKNKIEFWFRKVKEIIDK